VSTADRHALAAAYAEMYDAMLTADTSRLNALLDDDYVLVHMTGYRKPKTEWLADVASGRMTYHHAQQQTLRIEAVGDEAVVTGRAIVDATIWGSRGHWNLQLITRHQRRAGRWLATGTTASTY
jgi:ketosteroid isomerase-like protein